MAETKKASEANNESKTDKKPTEDKPDELSDEDKLLQEELNMLVERLTENNSKLYKAALESLRVKIRESTSSMTSVPKPLRFLRTHYETLKAIYEKIQDKETKRFCADIVSVLAMTASKERECLKFRMLGSKEEIGSWGHEYARHLSGEIAVGWNDESASEKLDKEELIRLTREIIPYDMKHNAEAEACDLLMEIERLELLDEFVDENCYPRVCLYLLSCVPYVPEPEDTKLLTTALGLFRKFKKYPEAMRCALQLNDTKLIREIFFTCEDSAVRKQLAFMLGRQQVFLDLEDSELEDSSELTEIISNSHLNSNFLALARELDIMDAKEPDDIYKTHLDPQRPHFTGQVDSAKQNLANSFVNGFVNAAFGQDKLMAENGNKWLYKNKDRGMLSAAASLGMILLWDVEGGLSQIDKYLYSADDNIKAGALLACGIVNSGVRNECDPALALLSDYVLHASLPMRIGAVLGLGLAYSGSNREDVLSLLLPVLIDSKSDMEVVGVTALACGLIAVGSCNDEVTSNLLSTLIDKSETELKDPYAKFLALGLGLNFLSCGEKAEAVIESVKVLPEPMKSISEVLIDVCAYAGSGNVLKVQHLLHICSEHIDENKDNNNEKDKKDKSKDKKGEEKKEDEIQSSAHQAMAVLGIALIAMGEDVGVEMSFRTLGHLLRYGEPVIKRAVPLALALVSVSNPRLNVLDTLSKFSHDNDPLVSYNSIFAMGVVGAGTNNARLAAMLRQLAQYYVKDPNGLFLVRMSQGMAHLGKGTMTMTPYHSDRMLMNRVAVAGLLAAMVAFLDIKTTILGKSHYLLYCLVSSVQPRMLVTFDEELNPLQVTVRVGQAVDVVGQAGKPKTITGFQTHTTPVLLAHGERAELATDEYIPLTPILEGFVILRKNPNAN